VVAGLGALSSALRPLPLASGGTGVSPFGRPSTRRGSPSTWRLVLEEGGRGEGGAGNLPKDNGGPGSPLWGEGVRAGVLEPLPRPPTRGHGVAVGGPLPRQVGGRGTSTLVGSPHPPPRVGAL